MRARTAGAADDAPRVIGTADIDSMASVSRACPSPPSARRSHSASTVRSISRHGASSIRIESVTRAPATSPPTNCA